MIGRSSRTEPTGQTQVGDDPEDHRHDIVSEWLVMSHRIRRKKLEHLNVDADAPISGRSRQGVSLARRTKEVRKLERRFGPARSLKSNLSRPRASFLPQPFCEARSFFWPRINGCIVASWIFLGSTWQIHPLRRIGRHARSYSSTTLIDSISSAGIRATFPFAASILYPCCVSVISSLDSTSYLVFRRSVLVTSATSISLGDSF